MRYKVNLTTIMGEGTIVDRDTGKEATFPSYEAARTAGVASRNDGKPFVTNFEVVEVADRPTDTPVQSKVTFDPSTTETHKAALSLLEAYEKAAEMIRETMADPKVSELKDAKAYASGVGIVAGIMGMAVAASSRAFMDAVKKEAKLGDHDNPRPGFPRHRR